MTKASALIVDDEADIRELVEITLTRMGLKTQSAATLKEAFALLAERKFDFCITDMRLPDGNGLSLIQHIQREIPNMPVAMITAYGNAQAAVESLKAGAFDFVSKPVDLATLRKLVDNALNLRKSDSKDSGGNELLGQHESVRNLRALIERLARSQAPVHIAGESGTGKERVAQLIHKQGPRSQAPFMPVNCGAIPTELMESEFFGHVKGSFTGAVRDKQGLFQSAEGGTLFLDEVADLPLHMQVKLLRAVQERAVRPVGAETEVPVNVRIISATHKNLNDLVNQGAFRQDLYYRLNVIEVRTPPLRERADDIPLLSEHILSRMARESGLDAPPKLDSAAQRQLREYGFPGNVRELENILERAITLCDGKAITASDLQLRPSAPVQFSSTVSSENAALGEHIEEIEKRAIREALEKARYNKTRAAELLGMSFRSLRYRIKKLNIE
jgi:two-component system response regulator PilR (NtrC family)